MAPKRPNPMEEPPTASSTEDEEEKEEESSEGEEEEEDEDEDEPGKASKPDVNSPAAATAGKKTQSSESESGTDSESETDSDSEMRPQVANSNVKPIATKPMDETPKSKKLRSKPAASPAKSAMKRASETAQDSKEAKRAKKEQEGKSDVVPDKEGKKSGEEVKKQLFQRVWSEDDEIVVLKGMLEYMSKKGTNPVSDMDAFHDFIKKSLHCDFSKSQLMDKIRRLRNKYSKNRKFSKPHEQKASDLSRKIWGSEGNGGAIESTIKSNGKKNQKGNVKALTTLKADLFPRDDKEGEKEGKKKIVSDENNIFSLCASEITGFDKILGLPALDERVVMEGLNLLDPVKKAEFEGKWKKYRIAQMELFLQRTDLIQEQAKLMLEAYKTDS
ncbi:probable transcription factor At1g61730 [Carica papaya]|uniref:probable transcription factor At1g61730 n=1 Tax=Carica papaya TaxID=3649 RepID=UPI000B8C6F2D|nr:probable transcription factor At1g61730 [Carica papaya]